MMRIQKQAHRGMMLAGVGVAALLLLGACDTIVNNNPTAMVSPGGIETYKDEIALEIETATLDAGKMEQVSRHYWAHGDTPLLLSVTYDPHSKINTAMKATKEAARLKTLLGQQGTVNVQADIMPVQDSGDASKTIITYDSVNARGPSECQNAKVDRNFTDWERVPDYKVGCASENYLAKQIARPKDLHGSDDMDIMDGRLQANTVELTKSGQSYPALKGESASE
jgi:type IV pilus biogenesis protein CpaD/CtpE